MSEQPERPGVGAQSISPPTQRDLPGPAIDMLKGAGGAAAAVDISENLPPLYTEIWYDADGAEEVHFSDKEEFHVPPFLPKGGENQSSGNMDKDRWDILMNKLTNIENNTSSLSADLNALTERVEVNSEQVSATKNAVSENEKAIMRGDRKFDMAWAEVDKNMQAKFAAMEADMRRENEAFKERVVREAELKAEIKAKDAAKEVTREIQDEVTQEKYDARKINLLIMGVPESGKGDTEDQVNSFLVKRMAISDIKVDIAYRLGKSGSRKPRPVLVRFKEMAHRNKVWFSKSKINKEGGRAWLQEDLPKAVKNSYRTFFRILRQA